MSDPTSTPIVVSASPTQPQIEAAVRQIILGLGAALGALGYADLAGKFSGFVAFAGPAAAIIAFVWGQIATRSHAQKAAAMADKLPDSVAQTK